MDLSKVYHNLYISDEPRIDDIPFLTSIGITHILTIMDRPLDAIFIPNFFCKFVYLLDVEEADLVEALKDCLPFVYKGTSVGTVLVHCFRGISRSAGVILAYMMQKENITFNKAFETLTALRPNVCPNQGFLQQLRLFEQMGSRINPAHPVYRQLRMNQLAHEFQATGVAPVDPIDAYVGEMHACPINKYDVYRCRVCRFQLFESKSLLPHMALTHSQQDEWRRRDWKTIHHPESYPHNCDPASLNSDCERTLFIEPQDWMQETITAPSGKIMCPNCRAKIGSFNWAGDQCSCGAWVTPSFHMQPTKVDKIPPNRKSLRPSNMCPPHLLYL